MLDSDAQSLPQGTFAIKAGPQTIMSQWVVTLDDGDEDEDDDDGQDADDDQVDVVDDVVSNNLNNNNNSVNYKNLNNTSNVNTGLLGNLNLVESVNAYTNGGAGTNYSEEEKWEDAVGTPHDLISSSSNNNRNISNKSPSIIHQQQHQQQMPSFSTANSISGLAANLGKSNSKLNSSLNAEEKNYLSNNIEIMAANANYKYINHSMSDDILNYESIYKNSTTNNNNNREMNFSPQANRYSQNSYNFYSQALKDLRFLHKSFLKILTPLFLAPNHQ